jgi:hypothetical protein
MVTVRVAGAPPIVVTVPLSVAPEHVTTFAAATQVNLLGPAPSSSAEMKLVPAGRTSWKVTRIAGSVPVLPMVIP